MFALTLLPFEFGFDGILNGEIVEMGDNGLQ